MTGLVVKLEEGMGWRRGVNEDGLYKGTKNIFSVLKSYLKFLMVRVINRFWVQTFKRFLRHGNDARSGLLSGFMS